MPTPFSYEQENKIREMNSPGCFGLISIMICIYLLLAVFANIKHRLEAIEKQLSITPEALTLNPNKW